MLGNGVQLFLSLLYITFFLYYLKSKCLVYFNTNFGLFLIMLSYLLIIYFTLSFKFIIQNIFYTSFFGLFFYDTELTKLNNYDNKLTSFKYYLNELLNLINTLFNRLFNLYDTMVVFGKNEIYKSFKYTENDKEIKNVMENMKSLVLNLNNELDKNEKDFNDNKKDIYSLLHNNDIVDKNIQEQENKKLYSNHDKMIQDQENKRLDDILESTEIKIDNVQPDFNELLESKEMNLMLETMFKQFNTGENNISDMFGNLINNSNNNNIDMNKMFGSLLGNLNKDVNNFEDKSNIKIINEDNIDNEDINEFIIN